MEQLDNKFTMLDYNHKSVFFTVTTPDTSMDYIKQGVMELCQRWVLYTKHNRKISYWDILSPVIQKLLKPSYIELEYKKRINLTSVISISTIPLNQDIEMIVDDSLNQDGFYLPV